MTLEVLVVNGIDSRKFTGLEANAIAVLRLLSLFDRPASKACVEALLAEPAVPGLTGPLVGLAAAEWDGLIARLASLQLLHVQADGALHADERVRESCAMHLRERFPDAWRQGHRRLYDHLRATTKYKRKAALADLQPLYQAIFHGCQAGCAQHALERVFHLRIRRGERQYSVKVLGAFEADLRAIGCFFERPYAVPMAGIDPGWQSWLLSEAAFVLRGLGRMAEAAEPSRSSLERELANEAWEEAAVCANNASELALALGDLNNARRHAERAIDLAARAADALSFLKELTRTTLADVLHQSGDRAMALSLFREAELMQSGRQSRFPRLYSLRGYRYCDALLVDAEQAAKSAGAPARRDEWVGVCKAVGERAIQALEWAGQAREGTVLDASLCQLTLSRTMLYSAILDGGDISAGEVTIESAVSGFVQAGNQQYLPPGLLTRAWLRRLLGRKTGQESAKSDLDWAWSVAERGAMLLYLADILLERVRLFSRESTYPWSSPEYDLAEARRIIQKHGYRRRFPEAGL